jgi:hypothetical protein
MRYGCMSHTRLYELIAAGKINAYKDGNKTLIDLNSVDARQAALPKIKPRKAS